MYTKKHFYVIAYDIADDRRRQKIVKVLEPIGVRINFSVFECMLTPLQVEKVEVELSSLIKSKEDSIAIYPVCKECFSKIEYFPKTRRYMAKKISVV